MAGSLTAQLIATNAILTEQIVRLATAVIENGAKPPVRAEVAVPQLPSFDEFSNEMSPEERLFYSEEEEDAEFAKAISGDTSGNPDLTRKILEAAGHHDLAAQVTAT